HDAGDDLDGEHEGEDTPEGPPVIQIAWRRIDHEGRMDQATNGQAALQPFHESASWLVSPVFAHHRILDARSPIHGLFFNIPLSIELTDVSPKIFCLLLIPDARKSHFCVRYLGSGIFYVVLERRFIPHDA